MPNIVQYSVVHDRLTRQGYRSLYFNGGAFGFPDGMKTVSRGWIGPPDESIHESARAIVRRAAEPYAEHLAAALVEIWKTALAGPVWAMPKSHWAYELKFGHRDWLPGVLKEISVDADRLAPLNNAAAIEFNLADNAAFAFFSVQLLDRLLSSDFQLVFPEFSSICTIHTRCQLWWTTADAGLVERLDAAAIGDGNAKP